MSRRVVVLSPGGAFTSALLALLAERGSAADALLLYDPGAAGGRRFLLPARWLSRRVRRRLAARPAGGAARVVFTGALNGARMTDDLRRLRPDVVVLAHSGLVKPPVLEIAGEGVVNVHPGLLPWIRGSSPLANSLLRRVPLGCTAFRVDAGIDTGPIVARRLVRVRGGETAAELRDALFGLWVEMTADLVGAARAGALPPGFAQAERFPLCRTLPPSERRTAVEEALRAGEPAALFERWRPLCHPSDLSLPAGADGPSVPHAG
jgi:methionyl-tRNA formyltransferase